MPANVFVDYEPDAAQILWNSFHSKANCGRCLRLQTAEAHEAGHELGQRVDAQVRRDAVALLRADLYGEHARLLRTEDVVVGRISDKGADGRGFADGLQRVAED